MFPLITTLFEDEEHLQTLVEILKILPNYFLIIPYFLNMVA